MSKLLEQIIRQVLAEGRIKISIETVKSEDLQIIKDVQTRLKIDPNKRKFETFDGLRVVLQRTGGRIENPDGSKTSPLDGKLIQTEVISKLNSLVGLYKPMVGSDYIWLITTDLRLNDKRDERRPKEERIFAKYSVTAIYIQKSLITKQIDATKTTGYLDTLMDGALVFSLDKINASQWIRRGNDKVDINNIELVNAPFGQVTFGKYDPLVKSLYTYFDLVNKFGYALTSDFNCELKGAVQQFQIENGLEATGDYDEATSTRARSLKLPMYVFKDIEAVKRLAAQCVTDQTKTKQDDTTGEPAVVDIKIPPGGFKRGIKNDTEFFKVQKLMENALIFLKFTTNEKHKTDSLDFINGIKKSPGTYGDKTKKVVFKLKWVMVNKAGNNLTNTSDELVDQQFIEILKTIK